MCGSYMCPLGQVMKKAKNKNKKQGGSLTRVSPAFAITYLCNHCVIRFDPIPVKMRKRSLTPRWPLTPRLLRPHVWLYPRIIVYKSHENTSKYVDTVALLAKTWTKGHWPLDDVWPHICWGHMCDSTHGSLYLSPMGIHQCMWVQWSILQITTYILHTMYNVLHTTYYIQNEWSHSLFLNSVQARQKTNPVLRAQSTQIFRFGRFSNEFFKNLVKSDVFWPKCKNSRWKFLKISQNIFPKFFCTKYQIFFSKFLCF